ncbi:UDP-N-acetylglucosamine 1-carboxyvinyltransferase [Candidatus Clavichlamydia salmonicola]|nr:UDP-N-acetylglucosamine 1-carboxyvinyltransferase [Candidatus Clavichlamydia salmonicola]
MLAFLKILHSNKGKKMSFFNIQGSCKGLKGEVSIAGAKNSVTKLLIASLLSDKKCILRNIPDISDVHTTVQICEELGSIVQWDKDEAVIEIETPFLKKTHVSQKFSNLNRMPVLLIGALLGRAEEEIIVPTVGGDSIGLRSVDFHVEAFHKMGAVVEYRRTKKDGSYLVQAFKGLHGAIIELPYSSVGATENIILAAVRAKGLTVIKNAAVEPEIMDLVSFLQKMGVLISLEEPRTLCIWGGKDFNSVDHMVIPDRIAAASYGMAAIVTQGHVIVKGINNEGMLSFITRMQKLGAGISFGSNQIEFFYQGPLRGGMVVETAVHPGFMTDWQQPFTVLLTQAHGASIIHETVHENRLGYLQTFKEMGGDLELFHECLGGGSCRYKMRDFAHSVVIKGPTPLQGQAMIVPDLRAGFAYVMAGLIAKGPSRLEKVHILDRGYAHLVDKLQALGADIERVDPILSNSSEVNNLSVMDEVPEKVLAHS